MRDNFASEYSLLGKLWEAISPDPILGQYLSLHEDSELEANGMPVPLQARPGIGVLQTAGRDFEDERNDQLIQSFGSLVIFQPDKGGTNKPVKAPMASLLGKVTSLPSIILQGKFEPATFQNAVMANIGVQPGQIAQVPRIAGLIPDIIVVRQIDAIDGGDGRSQPRVWTGRITIRGQWRSLRSENRSPRYTTRWDELPVVT